MKTKEYAINERLFDSYLERMNFLNEVSIDYPGAISFGSGRPDRKYFNVEEVISSLHDFAEETFRTGADAGLEEAEINAFGQYNRTKGIINETIVKLLANDEQITADPGHILMCDGAQEGMTIIINSLFGSQQDVLLVSDPSYIGFVGYAKIYGVPIVPVRRKGNCVDFDHLESLIKELQQAGKNPKCYYEVVDFHNPTGSYMTLEERQQLLHMAEKYNFLVVEDNPYGYFLYDGDKIPTLKALDTNRRVIYLGSFSKTIFPSIRLGYIIADQEIYHNQREIKLVEELKKTKSFTTVNTSTLLQAMAAGYLQRQNHSLLQANEKKIASLREKRDTMTAALAHYLAQPAAAGNVSWNTPRGGFFLVIDVPFDVTEEALGECVRDHGVIFCPMSFFCLLPEAGKRQIRLAFSNLSPAIIEQGIEKLSAFILGHC